MITNEQILANVQQWRKEGPLKEATYDFHVYFDGGTLGKNGTCKNGYGSWEVTFNRFSKKVSRQVYKASFTGYQVTNNVAEWLALHGALAWLGSVADKPLYTVNIYGDSTLVLEQLSSRMKCRNANLKMIRDECLVLLSDFKSWRTAWNARKASVRRFGH